MRSFKEKPDEEAAKEYIFQGALWNGGFLAYCIEYLLDKTEGFTDYQSFYDKYEVLEKISFDYAVIEKETEIWAMRFSKVRSKVAPQLFGLALFSRCPSSRHSSTFR